MAVTGGVVSAGIGNVGGLPGGGGLGSALRDRAMIEKVERNLRSATEGAQRAAEDLGRCAQCGSEEYRQRPFRP